MWRRDDDNLSPGMRKVKRRTLLYTKCAGFAAQWAELSGADAKALRSAASYHDYLEVDMEPGTSRLLAQYTDEVVDLLLTRGDWDSSGFSEPSLQELVLDECHGTQPRVQRVFRAFVCRNYQIGFLAGLAKMVVVLVAVVREENKAFWLLCTMIEDLRVSDFFARPPAPANGMLVEAEVLIKMVNLLFVEQCANAPRWPVLQKDGLSVSIDLNAQQLLGGLTLDVLPLDCMLLIWDLFFCSGDLVNGEWQIGTVTTASNAVLQAILGLVESCHLQIIACMKAQPSGMSSPGDAFLEGVSQVSPEQLEAGIASVMTRWDQHKVTELRQLAKKRLALDWTKGTRLDSLVRTTHFNKDEVDMLARWFENQPLELSGEGSGISKDEFIQVLNQMIPDMAPELYERLFEFADVDHSEDIDFKELANILSTLSQGSFEEKIQLAFEMYDVDRSGFLDEQEVGDLATTLLQADVSRIEKALVRLKSGKQKVASPKERQRQLMEELEVAKAKAGTGTAAPKVLPPSALRELATLGSPRESTAGEPTAVPVLVRTCSAYAKELISKMDVNHDGLISLKEFMDGAKQDSTLLRCFGIDLRDEESEETPRERPNLSFTQAPIVPTQSHAIAGAASHQAHTVKVSDDCHICKGCLVM
eukprot:TRINITY_DN10687_c0_g1_i1.p1 TRINITY_DN10687_c0_g1~~TRINITY_DN10687_c0_g1_i1.p1  ORF type:complete len:645 (-),score=151.69 TRINITY_DN10687_c0_g1_i1:201-2135(-)